MSLNVKDKIWVKYNNRASSKLWHARRVLATLSGSRYMILTPDGDMYVEDYSEHQDDVLQVKTDRAINDFGGDRTYDFTEEVSDGDMDLAIAKSHVILIEEYGEKVEVGLISFEEVDRDRGRGLGGKQRGSSSGKRTPEMSPPRGAGVGESDGLHKLRDSLQDYDLGLGSSSKEPPRAETPALVSGVDSRVLALERDSYGSRYRRFEDGIKATTLEPWPKDWLLKGPPTFDWCARFMVTNASSPTQWHQKWKGMCKLQDSDANVSMHFAICKYMEMTISYDQLNAPQLAGSEFMVRHLQMIEDRWKDRVLGDSSKASGAHLFTGLQDTQALCICPALNEWIAEELRKESAVLKEQRKAREERKQKA